MGPKMSVCGQLAPLISGRSVLSMAAINPPLPLVSAAADGFRRGYLIPGSPDHRLPFDFQCCWSYPLWWKPECLGRGIAVAEVRVVFEFSSSRVLNNARARYA